MNDKSNDKKPKILLWDVESSFNQVLTFDLYPERIHHNNIVTERHIICISYKWYGEKKIHTISILDDPKRFKKDIHDDYHVVSEFRKIIEGADAIVGHYQDKFDIPMLNARLVYNRLNPLPKIVSLDTKFMASRNFKFNSNRLDYLGKFLGYKGKMENPPNLWIDCFNGDKKAIEHMGKYNRQDIDVLDFVFTTLKPFVKNYKLNMNMFLKGAVCPTCGSENLEWRGWNYTKVNKYRRFICKDCRSWSDFRHAVKDDNNITIK